jgi:signal transduction histidine kinase
VGDLLQTVYATVAILERQLPRHLELERRVVAELKARAQGFRELFDTAGDLVCPLQLAYGPVALAELADRLVKEAAARHPHLNVRAEASAVPEISADGDRLTQAAEALLAFACRAAKREVCFTTEAVPGGELAWTVTADGSGVPQEQLAQLFTPPADTRKDRPGLRLALAHKVVALHGGQIDAKNLAPLGFRFRVLLPRDQPS